MMPENPEEQLQRPEEAEEAITEIRTLALPLTPEQKAEAIEVEEVPEEGEAVDVSKRITAGVQRQIEEKYLGNFLLKSSEERQKIINDLQSLVNTTPISDPKREILSNTLKFAKRQHALAVAGKLGRKAVTTPTGVTLGTAQRFLTGAEKIAEKSRTAKFLEQATGTVTETRKGRKRIVKGESQIADEILTEELTFEPFGEPIDIAQDVLGEGLFSDPFEGAAAEVNILAMDDDIIKRFEEADLLNVVPPDSRQPTPFTAPPGRRAVSVPAIKVQGRVRNKAGQIGYRISWQGEDFYWFPPNERIVRAQVRSS